MKKNNYLLLLAILTVGCNKSKGYPTLFSKLEKKANVDERLLLREVAATQSTKCLKDVFSVELLKAEVKELEKKYTSGTKVSGTWKHLNLAKLPIPQATFLKRFGNKIGDMNDSNAFDYSACKDVPCVFNTIYGKEDDVAGYVHYIWYLRVGNLLAATNTTHDSLSKKPGLYNEKQFPVSAYLYRDGEIYAFWRLSHMLKAPHTTLKDFKEIYRVPQGESFDFVYNERKGGKASLSETCGLAYSSGYVILQDLCLTLHQDWESGDFYQSVLHELTHQLDYDEGSKIGKTYRSSEEDYLDVSRFVRTEYKDTAGVTKREWNHKPGVKIVSNYAGTSPAENFAETVALFRVNGSHTKFGTNEDHYDFISKNYYAGTNFERKTLIDNWISQQSSPIAQMAFKAVGDCTRALKPMASTYFKKTDFSVAVLPSMLNCLGSKASEISIEIANKIRVTEVDGCGAIGGSYLASTWEPKLKAALTSNFNKYLLELQNDKTYFAKIQSFIDGIPDSDIANEAYLSCLDLETEKECYREAVLRLSLEKLAPLNLPEAHANDLAEMYLANHELKAVRDQFKSFYSAFVLSHKEPMDLEAEDVFTKCLALPLSDVESPVGKHFSVDGGYMASSIYNCINTEFPEAAKTVVRNLAVDDMTVKHPKEELLLYNEVVPELQKSLEAYYEAQKALEVTAVSEFLAADQGVIRKTILSDLSWIKNFMQADVILRDCQALASSKIEFPLRYQIRKDAFKALVEDSCRDIEKSPEFVELLKKSKAEFDSHASQGLEVLIMKHGRAQATVCSREYPIDTFFQRIKNGEGWKECLDSRWEAVEKNALNAFSRDPVVMRFKVDMTAIKQQLVDNRDLYQNRLKKENGFR